MFPYRKLPVNIALIAETEIAETDLLDYGGHSGDRMARFADYITVQNITGVCGIV